MLPLFWLRVIGWALLAASLAGAGAAFIHHQRELGAAPEREKAQRAEAAASRAGADLAEAARRGKTIQEAQDAEFIARTKAEADARRASAANGSLQSELAATRAAFAASDAAASASGQAAGQTIAVLTELLGRCSDRRRELARYADQAAGSGQLCEQSYDALNAPR